MNCFFEWNNWLSKRMFVLVLLAIGLGCIIPLDSSTALWLLVIALFAYITFVTSLETSLKQFIRVLNRPWISAWILFLAHFVTPCIAWMVGSLFFPDDFDIKLGYLISASIPVGVTSVIWTSLIRGNVTVSLVTVTLDTLIVPILLPFVLLIAVGRAVSIDYGRMMLQLLVMITIPSVAGMMLNDYTRSKAISFAHGLGGLTTKIAFFLVIFLNAAVVMPIISWNLSMIKILLVTLLMVVAAYLIGYFGGLFLKNRSRENTVALVYNVGLRNISAGFVLAQTHFSPPVAIPITLFMLYQQPLASLVPYLFRLNEISIPKTASREYVK